MTDAVGNRTETTHQAGTGSLATVLSMLDSEPLDIRWRNEESPQRGEPVTLSATTTRCRAQTVHRHLLLTRRDGGVLGEGSAVFQAAGEHQVHTDFGTVGWAKALRPLLEANTDFVDAVTPMDGVIGLAAGDEAVQLRIYKGQILEVARSTPTGPTFTLTGSELAWTELATAPRNDFIPRTMSGKFTATGNKHEYLRFTKAIVSTWDSIRELASA